MKLSGVVFEGLQALGHLHRKHGVTRQHRLRLKVACSPNGMDRGRVLLDQVRYLFFILLSCADIVSQLFTAGLLSFWFFRFGAYYVKVPSVEPLTSASFEYISEL